MKCLRLYKKYIIFSIFLIFCFCFTAFILKNIKPEENIVFTSEFYFYEKDREFEIKVDNQTKNTIFSENGVDTVIYKYPRKTNGRISYPDMNKITAKNTLLDVKPYMNYTYNLSFLEGFQYIKYLLENGYSLERYISTSEYLEVFLKSEIEIYKRIVLYPNTVMVCDMLEGTELPEICEYLRPYNYDGFIEKKFNYQYKNLENE